MIHSLLLAQTVRIAGLACSIDPITLTGLALAAGTAGIGAAGALSGGGAGTAPTPATPPAPAAAAPAQQSPTGAKAGGTSNTPSFVGSAAVPSQVGYGQKSLLGQ